MSACGITSMMLSKFWTASPAGWFRSVEAQFMVHGITSKLVLAAVNKIEVDKGMAVTEEEPTEESTPFQLVNWRGSTCEHGGATCEHGGAQWQQAIKLWIS
jgi:hypothetical protein